MIIGEKAMFAIEYEIDEEYEGTWLYGKMCYWIGGKPVGDYDLVTSLRDAFVVMEPILCEAGNRTGKDLFNMHGTELFNRLHGGLFGDDSPEFEELAEEEGWMRFHVSLPLDMFGGWHVYLLENNREARFLVGKPDPNEGCSFANESTSEAGVFDEVICKVYEELKGLWQIERSKELNEG